MIERIVLVAVLAALALWGLVRPQRPAVMPPVMSITQVKPWMVDALPGIGPKRRAAALLAVAAGQYDDLPKPARAVANQVFILP